MNRGNADTPFDADASAPTLDDRTWMARALESCSDPVFVLDASMTVSWVNTAGAALVGLDRDDALGRSLVDYVHPDDLVRAAEVLGLASIGVFDEVSITPALYRVSDGNGGWTGIEVNASLPGPDGSILILGRVGGDLVIADRLLEAVTANAPFSEQVQIVLELALWRHPLEGYTILYHDLDGSRRSIASSGLDPLLSGDLPTDEVTPWDTAVATGRDVVIADLSSMASEEPSIGPTIAAAARRAGYVGCLAAPVRDEIGGSDASIVIWTTSRGPTHAGHAYALANMRRSLTLVLQQRSQRFLLEQAARRDDLTGLLSRAGFFEVIQDGSADLVADGFGVLYVDLDGFKQVNDTHGHTIGDRVLVAAGERIAQLAPDGSIIARLGGDEFVIVCPARNEKGDAEVFAQQIVDALRTPIDTAVGRIFIGASVGLAKGRAGEPVQRVLETADAALLSAKAAGRSRWTSG